MADRVKENAHHSLGTPPATGRRGARLREVAYRAIKEAILNASLKPEIPLVEEHLASELQISRTPVREALAILEHEGLIEVVPYQGMFVKEVTANEFLEMYEGVGTIEPELARRAAAIATPDDIAAMEELLLKAEQYFPDDAPRLLGACRMFQQKIGECARNDYLTALLITIEERSDLYLITKWQVLPPDKLLAAINDRRAILDAIRARDPDLAAQRSLDHARAARLRWKDLFSKYDTI